MDKLNAGLAHSATLYTNPLSLPFSLATVGLVGSALLILAYALGACLLPYLQWDNKREAVSAAIVAQSTALFVVGMVTLRERVCAHTYTRARAQTHEILFRCTYATRTRVDHRLIFPCR